MVVMLFTVSITQIYMNRTYSSYIADNQMNKIVYFGLKTATGNAYYI